MIYQVLWLIGFLMFVVTVLKAIKFLKFALFIETGDILKKYGEKSWVLITGSTGGFGVEFAK